MSGAIANSRTNPFPGLRPFREDEEYLFFGRESQVDAVIDKLADTHFLAVIGTSGSGKSSLVNCGLRPALRQGLMARAGTAWRMAQFRPGNDPIGAMARALGNDGVLFRETAAQGLSPAEIIETTLRMSKLGLIDIFEQARLDEGANLLVVVDQFEELFRYRHLDAAGRDGDPRVSEELAAFVNLLLEVKDVACSIFVVLTMRSDFLGDCAQFPGLPEAINSGLYLVPRMTRDERRIAIEGPVRVAGAEIAPVLLTRLVNDVGDNPDQLSILQHALNRTWARCQDELHDKESLDLRHYEAIGTMANALDQHAEQAYAELGATRPQQICEKLFKALTDKATDPRGVRRPTELRALCAVTDATATEVVAVIEVFRDPSRSFLMPPAGEALVAGTVIDISHESLMRLWQRLSAWAEGERDFLVGKQRLEQDLPVWQKAPTEKDKADVLLKGLQLFRARGWLIERPNELTAQERAFIQASIQRAEEDERRTIANESRALAALSQAASLQGHFTDAVKLALAAWPRSAADKRPQLSRTIDALGQAISRPLEVAPPLQHKGPVNAAAFAPDGARVATASDDKTARVWDAATGAPIGKPLQHDGEVVSVAFSPDGALVVTSSGKIAQVWDAVSGAPVCKPLRHKSGVNNAAFSPDGALVVTSSGKIVQVWDAVTGAPIGKPSRRKSGVTFAAFSPDGTRVLTAFSDNTARVWDAAGAQIGKAMRHKSGVTSVAFGPDGKRVVSASEDWTSRIWDAATGTPLGRPLQHEDAVNSAAFSPDGARVATACEDGNARLWDAATGARIGLPLQHEAVVNSATFSPDGARVVTASEDKTARIWDAAIGVPVGSPLRHRGHVISVAFSRDGKQVVTVSSNITARLWDAKTGAAISKRMQQRSGLRGPALSPDSALVATASDDETAQVWDAATGAPIGQHLQHEAVVNSAAFSPDGARVVTASADKTARLWDAASGTQIGSALQHEGPVNSAAISPDGARVVTASADKTARLWDAASGAQIGSPLQHEGPVNSAAFSPDGARVVTASDDKTARVWDATTGAPIGQHLQHADRVWSAAFSPDGARMVTASADKTARLWDEASGTQIGSPLQHEGPVNSAAFSPDGALVVTASTDRTARVWDAATGALIGKRLQHDGAVNSAAFSPDGARVVTASIDRTARVWDAATGAPIGPALRHEDRVCSAAFSPDGARVATASDDKTARVWLAPPAAPNIFATACKMLGDHDTAGLSARYGIAIDDPICGPDVPAPDPKRMIDR